MGYAETNQGDLNPHFSLSTRFPVYLFPCLPVSPVSLSTSPIICYI